MADLEAAMAIDPKDADTHEARGVRIFVWAKATTRRWRASTRRSSWSPTRRPRYTHRGSGARIKGDFPRPWPTSSRR